MDVKNKERGILKLEPRPRVTIDISYRSELTPQGSCEHGPSSPQPSVDRLSVTWADPGSMTSSGVNLFHLPSEMPVSNEVKFSPTAGDGSEDEDYSASLSAVLRQRRTSIRRSRKGRVRRPSSPFIPDEVHSRRRSSVFTASSGDTAISMEEAPAIVTQEQIFENIHLHKEVLGSVKQQPLGLRRKLKIVHQAKGYIKRHEGQLQERLAQSKSTRDIYARFNILLAAKLQQLKREAANTSNLLIPWELRIKEIESHFGSVVASYFTFLRWLFWVNLVIGFILLVFVIVPEYLTANPLQDGERKMIMEEERANATNLLTLWEFEGVLKCTPIFYGYYSNIERPQYRMPLAYFLTGLIVYIYSFVAILRKMAENSRMSKLSEKEDECIFSWKLFTGWDFMIGNAETAHNRIASVILGFKEALLEEAEKKKDLRNWRIISLRALVNVCVIVLLAVSAYAVVHVVSRSDDNPKFRSWWRENETTIVVTIISITFPVFFELLGFLEHYHPRKQLRLQLARIMLLNLLNLYSLIFALFSKIEGMSKDLDLLKPTLNMNVTIITPDSTLNLAESLVSIVPTICVEISVPCEQCSPQINPTHNLTTIETSTTSQITDSKQEDLRMSPSHYPVTAKFQSRDNVLLVANLEKNEKIESTTIDAAQIELQRLRKINKYNERSHSPTTESTTSTDYDYNIYEDDNNNSDYDILSTISRKTNDYDYITTTNNIVITADYSTDTTQETFNTKTTNLSSYYGYSNQTEVNTDTTETSPDLNNISEKSTEITYSIEYSLSTDESSLLTADTEDVASTEAYTPTSEGVKLTDLYPKTTDFQTTEINSPYINSGLMTNHIVSHTTRTRDDTTFMTTISTKPEIEVSLLDILTENCTDNVAVCPEFTFNCSVSCGSRNVTQVITIFNCSFIERACYETKCDVDTNARNIRKNYINTTTIDVVYIDENNIKQYNLTVPTRKKLMKLCWETMFGQELVKLTMMDLVFVLLGTLFMDFFRALFVRYMNRCWCWDLEKKFPEYGDFKIAENILHLINNQGMVWMGMFFSPGLVVLNVVKLMLMMYLRSWAVMTCNVPHEVVFRVSKSNNFYLALLLTMLFLCVLPVGYTIVWVKPSWHCGPFSEYDKIYYILTNNIYKILPKSLNFALEYIASPAIVIPLLVLLILIIYYLTSLTNSLREANNDLKIQLRRERTEERRKMFQLADTRRRVGSSAIDNTPFARWKKALPSLPLSKSIDSDDRKTITGDETAEPLKSIKKRGGIFAKIVNLALDKKSDVSATSDIPSPFSYNMEDETDTDFHETLPKEILKVKDITISRSSDQKKKNSVEFRTDDVEHLTHKSDKSLEVNLENINDQTEKKAIVQKLIKDKFETNFNKTKPNIDEGKNMNNQFKTNNEKQTSVSSIQSRQSDSIGSVIPVIMISTTESDEEILEANKGKKDIKTKEKKRKEYGRGSKAHEECDKKIQKSSSDSKPLQRQNSVDSIKGQKTSNEVEPDNEGHKYQYSL